MQFEKAKGEFTAVTDDLELIPLKGNTKTINVSYHGDLKKAVMETKRTLTGEGDQNSNGVLPPLTSPSYMDELASVPTTQRYGPPPTTKSYTQQRPARNNYHHASGDERVHQQQQEYNPPTNYTTSPRHQRVIQPATANNTSPYSSRGVSHVVYSSEGVVADVRCGSVH